MDTLTIEMLLNGAWVDVSSYVMKAQRVAISRPSAWLARGTKAAPTTCDLTLKNLGSPGPWSYQTPGSTYYGVFQVGTQLRVKRGSRYRFWGEISDIELSADSTGRFPYARIQAGGALQNQSVTGKPIRGTLFREFLSDVYYGTSIVAYWSFEENTGATTVASSFTGIAAGRITGDFNFAADTDLPGASPGMPTPESGSVFRALVPAAAWPASHISTSTAWTTVFMFKPISAPASNTVIMSFAATGYVKRYDLVLSSANILSLLAYDSTGAVVWPTDGVDLADDPDFIGRWCVASISAREFAGGPDWLVSLGITLVEDVEDGAFSSNSVSYDVTANAATQPIGAISITSPGSGTMSIGHLSLWTGIAGTNLIRLAAQGQVGETGSTRIDRVSDENTITLSVRGTHSAGNGTLGAQPQGSLLDVYQDAADSDGGMLFDTRDSLGISYVTRMSLYNQLPSVDFAWSNFQEQPAPNVRNTLLRNDVEVSRPAGTRSRVTIPDGDTRHYTTQTPGSTGTTDVIGVGVRDTSFTINTETDAQTRHQASWYAHILAHKSTRIDDLEVELSRATFETNTTLRDQILDLDIGRFVRLSGQPTWVPPESIELLVHGYRELMDKFTHQIIFQTASALPWEVEILDTGGMTLAAPITSGSTSLKLGTSLGPEGSTITEPYHVSTGGEAMTVTALTTDTPAYIAVGAAAHGNNASVAPALPAGITVDTGQSLILIAAIRNSGTGTVDTPSGWTVLAESGNVKVMHRYYVTGVTAPTVTFTGGVANADTTAQIAAFSGLSNGLASGTSTAAARTTPAAVAQLNSSAQNIAYPAATVLRAGGVVLYVGWKQDDLTSATGPGDAEIAEASTTTGNDQSMVWYYDIYTTATDVAAGSMVITGGASAISRAIVLALRPLQTATVTRGVGGTTAATHAVGSAIHAWRLGAIAQ